jgi:hypothetical protein
VPDMSEDILASSVELLKVEVSFIEATLIHSELFQQEVDRYPGK